METITLRHALETTFAVLTRLADSTAVLNHLPEDAQHQICEAITEAGLALSSDEAKQGEETA